MNRLITLALAFFVLAAVLGMTACGKNSAEDNDDHASVEIQTYAPDVTAVPENDYSQSESIYYQTPATELTEPPLETQTTPTQSTYREDEPAETEYNITDYEAVMYANAAVNIREEPDADSERISLLDEGEEVLVTGIVSNGWYRIRIDGEEYYVNGRYLSDYYEADAEQEYTEPAETEPAVTTQTTAETTRPATTTTEEEIVIDEIELPEDMTSVNKYTALNYENQKAVWFAYLDIDTMLSGATEEEFTREISEAFLNVRAIGCNTVYVHVRAFGDAYYFSNIYPFAAAYSGTIGVAPDFDPLEIMIDEAHKLGLSFHAWINPMRTANEKRFEEMSDNYMIKRWYDSDETNGTYLVYDDEGGYYWLSPAYTAVRELICSGIAEIVTRYDVDAIHIDDYFYPTTDASFDEAAFEASGYSDLASWRREIVSRLVADIYSTVKSCNSTVLFGVSPQGNVSNNLNKLYADVERWCAYDGYLDYVVPQIYYGYSGSLPFDEAAQQWRNLVTNPNVTLVCGIAAYKVGTTTEWSSGRMLSEQTEFAKALGYDGCAYYRYSSLFSTGSDVSNLITNEISGIINAMALF